MKRLTINRIASAGIRHNKRAYMSLAMGIFLSIFLITVLCLTVQGVLLARDKRVDARVGSQDAFYMASPSTDQQLLETGFFTDQIGHVYVNAKVGEFSLYTGWYDETAADMLQRVCTQGRMPESTGEIALEQSALELMRSDAELGESIALELTPIDGEAEIRTFTIVGILKEQTAYLDANQFFGRGQEITAFPGILLHPDEQPLNTGRIVQHRLLTFVPGVNHIQVLQHDWDLQKSDTGYFAVMLDDGSFTSWIDGSVFLRDSEATVTVTLIVILGSSLLLGACVAISGALESQLARKREEIGMLRAVGATQRQIRRIFGREAWLLALVLSPLSVAIGTLVIWISSLFAPDILVFKADPMILIPILLLTMIIIWASSSLPLRRAARLMPMSVIRDTQLLRKSVYIKPRMNFKVPQLISLRQFVLHPSRQLGSILLMALMMIVNATGIYFLTRQSLADSWDRPEYSLSPAAYRSGLGYVELFPRSTLTDADIQQLRALPLVERVEVTRETGVYLLFEDDAIPDYIRPDPWAATNNYHRTHLTDLSKVKAEDSKKKAIQSEINYHDQVRQQLGISQSLAGIDFFMMEINADDLPAELSAGKIDLAALDAGKEVLVYAPDRFYEYDAEWSEQEGIESYSLHNADTYDYLQGKTFDYIVRNDYFKPGLTLNMLQLWAYQDHADMTPGNIHGQCEKATATVKVGAVLQGENTESFHDITIITTEKGARALGIKCDILRSCEIHLSDLPDKTGEEYLTQRIETIGMRGDTTAINYIAIERESRSIEQRMGLAMMAVTVILMIVSVSLIAGNIRRQIHADIRMIGTLRAVGADRETLIRCYSGSVWMITVLGLILGAAIIAFLWAIKLFAAYFSTTWTPWLMSGSMLVFAALTLGICQLLVRQKVSEIIRHSIIENIREL